MQIIIDKKSKYSIGTVKLQQVTLINQLCIYLDS